MLLGVLGAMLADVGVKLGVFGSSWSNVGAKMAIMIDKMAIKSAKMSQDRRQEEPREPF